MLFNSIEFVFFFVIVFGVHWWILGRQKVLFQNAFLLIASYFFLGWWDYRFLLLLLISSLSDYFISHLIAKSSDQVRKKVLLTLSISINLIILLSFKYFSFFTAEFAKAFTVFGIVPQNDATSYLIPIGISFYTFQTMSYTIDVYRNQTEPSKSIVAFLSYVSFFPQLIAGPIERANHLLTQFYQKKHFDYKLAVSGLKLITWGLFKKVVIADRLSEYVDQVYTDPLSYTGLAFIINTFFFGIQVYCDFSGYSDIAIGSARLLGFKLNLNFNFPYFQSSLKNYWRNWHISLSNWFRDYIYIPIGGSKNGQWFLFLSLLVTFIISGLWHGNKITFMIWGALHAIFLFVFGKFEKFSLKIPAFLRGCFTFLLVLLLLVLFRSNSLQHSLHIYTHLSFTFDELIDYHKVVYSFAFSKKEFVITMLFLLFFMATEYFKYLRSLGHLNFKIPYVIQLAFQYILVLSSLFFGKHIVESNFIYFQF